MTHSHGNPDLIDHPQSHVGDGGDIADVIVIGGGAAGLAAAVTLGRARRSVTVIDAGQPRNAAADGVHNFLTREGTPPRELLELGAREARSYGAQMVSGKAISATRADDGFVVDLADGGAVRARRLIVASGLRDELPALPGVSERWGRDVIHCPYCHGYEVRDQRIAVLATGPMALHQVMLFAQLSNDVVYVRHTAPEPTAQEREQLAARGIAVVETPADSLVIADDRLTGVRLTDGSVIDRDVLVVAPRMVAASPVLTSLGVASVPHPMGAELGECYPADPMTGAATVPGVWLAGNVQQLQAQVISSAAQGVNVAAMANADLVAADTALAVEAHRAADPVTTFWEGHYGKSEQIWSGRVNPILAEVAGQLPPGRALDVGCGEGGDAIWLATKGWQVSAIDVSPTALDRTTKAAQAAHLGDRVTTGRYDLERELPTGEYDLVTAQFFQSPMEFPRGRVLRELAGLLAVDGRLLVVDHGSAPSWSGHDSHEFPTVEQTRDAIRLDPQRFDFERCDTAPRTVNSPDGEPSEILDNVLMARRTA